MSETNISAGRSDRPEDVAANTEPDDPTAGLPEDLARVLRDQSIIVPQDQAVWELLAKWRNAPSNTASADLPEKQ